MHVSVYEMRTCTRPLVHFSHQISREHSTIFQLFKPVENEIMSQDFQVERTKKDANNRQIKIRQIFFVFNQIN